MQRVFPWWLRAFLIAGAIEAIAIGASSWLAPQGSLSRRLLPVSGGTLNYSSATYSGFDPANPASSAPNPSAFALARLQPLNARVIGALYLAGAVGLIASYLARQALDARIFIFGFGFIASSLLLITLAYWTDFTADHIPYGWLISYIVDPLVAAIAILALGLMRPTLPGPHRLTPLLLFEGAVLGLCGLLLLLAPRTAAKLWPWTINDLLARIYACFLLGFALGALLAAWEKRVLAIRPFAIASAAMPLFVIIASVRYLDLLRHGLREWTWFGTFSLLGLLFVAFLPSLFREEPRTFDAAKPTGSARATD